jgi:hypothetical protein
LFVECFDADLAAVAGTSASTAAAAGPGTTVTDTGIPRAAEVRPARVIGKTADGSDAPSATGVSPSPFSADIRILCSSD